LRPSLALNDHPGRDIILVGETENVDTAEQQAAGKTLDELLARALAGAGGVLVVGDGAERLAAQRPDVFARKPSASVREVVALGLDEATLAQAAGAAEELGIAPVNVLVETGSNGPASVESAREALHRAGLFLTGADRLLWEPAVSVDAVSRSDRLRAQTSALIIRCVLRDHPEALERLEEAIVALRRDVDVLGQVAVDHARTRDVERERAERLARLERLVDDETRERLSEENALFRSQLEEIQATRVWRMGQRWWGFRDRIRGRPS
jgi:hypothetical protein